MKTYAAVVATRHLQQAVWDEVMMEVVAFMCNLGRPYPRGPDAPWSAAASGPEGPAVPTVASDGRVDNDPVGLAFVPPRRTYTPAQPEGQPE